MALGSGAALLAACTAVPTGVGSGANAVIEVVAAENVWGSVAAQLGGTRVHVVSLVTNPNADPHSYEPTSSDARAVARARVVVENGIGYDPWVDQLISAGSGRPDVVDAGRVLDVSAGGNPHTWYKPEDVYRMVGAISKAFERVDPAGSRYFSQREVWFLDTALGRYRSTISAIRSGYTGVPVGASESIFAMMAPDLGLDLVTPRSLLRAVSEGSDVSAADKETVDAQIRTHAISLYVYNRQNATPDVQAQLDEVRAAHIPYVPITETLVPAGATFQDWQVRQLLAIQAALGVSAHMGR